MELFNLEKHFAFYGAYHSNPINIIIHILFVWPILFTSLMLLYFTPPLFFFNYSADFFGQRFLILNYGFLFTVIYSLFYVGFDRKAGALAALMCFGCWVGSSYVSNSLGASSAVKIALVGQLVCWIGQFLGHGIFEKRAPALFDNLAQAFLMAPFFVLLEVLQSVFGYEPYPGFHARVKATVDSEINNWQEKKQKKIT